MAVFCLYHRFWNFFGLFCFSDLLYLCLLHRFFPLLTTADLGPCYLSFISLCAFSWWFGVIAVFHFSSYLLGYWLLLRIFSLRPMRVITYFLLDRSLWMSCIHIKFSRLNKTSCFLFPLFGHLYPVFPISFIAITVFFFAQT